ncbi:IS5 family transposase [Planctomicrobium sp. SH664]|uniref:IS5 family transposase n=1 Tax=Planctomicrobium sp. SH664 TaxID=3448125 RepID=UPI003F5B6CC5
MIKPRTAYPFDVTDEEWAFLAPYLALGRADSPQRVHSLRLVFNAMRWLVRTGAQWRFMPHEFPPWPVVDQQPRRWLQAGVFEDIAHDLRAIARVVEGREEDPSGIILDGRVLQSTPVNGKRAGYDGHKRRKGSKIHIAIDTLGHLLAVKVTPANEQERAQVAALCEAVPAVTGETVEVAYVDQGDTGETAEDAAAEQGIQLRVVKHARARRGFVLLPRRWVVERTFPWLGRSRRLARDYERLAEVLAGWHWVAMVALLLKHAHFLMQTSS